MDKALPADPDGRYSSSMLLGLAVLRCVGRGSERGVKEVADELGLSQSTTHRYMSTLCMLGWLEHVPRSLKYQLGKGAFDTGMQAVQIIGLGELAWPHLAHLREVCGGAASIAVLDESDVVYLARAANLRYGLQEVPGRIGAGSRFPMLARAAGELLLAYTSGLEMVELAQIRLRGFATTEHQGARAYLSIAAPVLVEDVVRAAIEVTVPVARDAQDLAKSVEGPLVMVASAVSQDIAEARRAG